MKLKLTTKKVLATVVASVMTVGLFSDFLGKVSIRADVTKNQENTCLGTSKFAAPAKPEDRNSSWSGSYVYYGTYNDNPIKFRVLAPSTTAYGGSTLFLDSDKTLFSDYFDYTRPYSNAWDGSDIQGVLNGSFLNGFTSLEQGAIATSQGNGGLTYDSFLTYCYGAPVSVNDKVFLLDASEVMNPTYGYTSDCGWVDDDNDGDWSTVNWSWHEVANRVKGGSSAFWWLRSANTNSSCDAGGVYDDGYLIFDNVLINLGVAPALNVNQSSIIFSSLISGKFNTAGAEYKLTIADDDLTIAVPAGQGFTAEGTTITVPYEISGKDARNATRASVLILDESYGTSGAQILYYDALGGTFSNSKAATGTFTLPSSLDVSGWGKDYYVYILAEDINGEKETDYASKPVEIKTKVTVTFNSNGGSSVVAQTVDNGSKATKPTDPTKSGYTFDGWYKDSACTTAYDFDSAVTADITLYAKWTAVSNPDPVKPDPTTTPEPTKGGGFEDFVERLYTVALGRASEPEGKAFWSEHVGNGDLTGAQCANEFLLSKEFNDRGLNDEQFLTVLYYVFFDRPAADDPDGFNFWMNSLKTQGRDVVVDCFINSEEWCNVCATYGVKSGATRAKATIASENAKKFATRLYTECLGRDPEEGGLKFWSLGLTNLELTGSAAAHEFFFCQEFNDHNFDNKELITRMYKTFMGRDPDDDGMAFWLDSMDKGLTKQQVFDNFVQSPEFTQICKDYAIDRG